MSDLENKSPTRYRLQIIVNRDLVCPPEGLDEVVSFELGKLGDLGYTCVAHHVNRLRERPQKKRLAEFKVEDVIPFITASETKREYVVNGVPYVVRMNSQRYFVFRDSMSCVACGLTGTKMLLEQHPGDKSAHFNLYAEEDDNLVLMTKDHIRAKAVGGEDRHSNYQTMCSICNNIKASDAISVEDLRTLRLMYNRNVKQMPKKQLHKLIEDAKSRMPRRHRQEANWQAMFVTLYDLNLFAYHGDDVPTRHAYSYSELSDAMMCRELEAVSVYTCCQGEHVACMSKGVPLVGESRGDWLLAVLTDGTRVRMPIKFVRAWEPSDVSEQTPDSDKDRGGPWVRCPEAEDRTRCLDSLTPDCCGT
jgi:hypothetical protein